MSAAPSLAFDEAPRRVFPRHPINVPLDVIALRSGVPETLPGRCTDISEAGVGAVVAGEMKTGQQVAIELRLPDVGVPVRARALVRYQSRLHCGLEFIGLSVNQREMIRYWVYRSAAESKDSKDLENRDFETEAGSVAAKTADSTLDAAAVAAPQSTNTKRRIRIGRRGFYFLLVCALALAALGWWQWQRFWNELEKQTPVGESGLRVSPATMDMRIVTKIDPLYPEAARSAGTEGMVVLDAVIASDGSVKRVRTVSGPELLAQSATQAVQFWKYEPYLSSGQAVEVETTIAVEFRLN
jgi:TonB family protein